MTNERNLARISIKNFLPRGAVIHEAPFVVGIVVYVGRDTKINQNMRKVGFKNSWLISYMNKTIYSLLLLQFLLVVFLSVVNMGWQNNIGIDFIYLQDCEYNGFADWFVIFCQHYTHVSHLVPISLYVVIEIMKLILTI